MSEDLEYYEDELEPHSGGLKPPMARRFRGYLPVVVDVETGGFNAATDALLEIAAVTIGMDEEGLLFPEHTYFFRIEPFAGANIEQAALDFTGIKLDHPLRMAVSEEQALGEIFRGIRKSLKANGCKRRSWSGTTAVSTLAFSMPRSIGRRSSATRSILSRASIPRLSPVWLMVRQSWPRPVRQLVLPSTARKHTRRVMTPRRRPSCSAASSTAGNRWAAGWTTRTECLCPERNPALAGFFVCASRAL